MANDFYIFELYSKYLDTAEHSDDERAAVRALVEHLVTYPNVGYRLVDSTADEFIPADHLKAIFDSPEYREVERENELWRLRGEYIDAIARSDVAAFGGKSTPYIAAARRLVEAADAAGDEVTS